MVDPLVPQGFLNRVRGAVSITDVPVPNITASYLGKDGISIRPDGPATDVLPTTTGTVGSRVPYQQATLTVHVLRAQELATNYQQRFTTDTALGEVVVTPDVAIFDNFTLLSYYLVNFNEMPFNGMDAEYVVTISSYLITSDNMWI